MVGVTTTMEVAFRVAEDEGVVVVSPWLWCDLLPAFVWNSDSCGSKPTFTWDNIICREL